MAGYSGTPLPLKLGLKPGARFGVWSAPPTFAQTLGTVPKGVLIGDASRGSSPLDVIVCFVSSRADLVRLLPRAQKRLDPSGGLWLCWPKRSSGVVTDVTENAVRNLGLGSGLVDNKVCAIDEVWSGLRLVVRIKDRPKHAPSQTRPRPRPTRPTRPSSGAALPKTSRKTAKRTVKAAKTG
jgi:hypothetical protein